MNTQHEYSLEDAEEEVRKALNLVLKDKFDAILQHYQSEIESQKKRIEWYRQRENKLQNEVKYYRDKDEEREDHRQDKFTSGPFG